MCPKIMIVKGNNTMSIILDILTIVIIIVIIGVSYSKGLIRSVIELAGLFLSGVAAYFLSIPVGDWIYQHLLKSAVYDGVSNYLTSVAGGFTEAFNNLLSQYNISGNVINSKTLASGQSQAQGLLMDNVVAPIASSIGRGIAFIIIFIVCLFLVGIIAKLSDIVFKIPVISGLNHIGGAIIGVLKAAIVMFVICTILVVLIPIFSLQKNPPITNTTINSTFILKHIYDINPVRGVLFKN